MSKILSCPLCTATIPSFSVHKYSLYLIQKNFKRLISVKLSSYHYLLVSRSMWKKPCICVTVDPCYINECCFDRWWRNQTTQSWEDDKKDERSEKICCAHFFLSGSAFGICCKWNTVHQGEDKRWQKRTVSISVPISHTQRRPDERWKANTGDCHKGGHQCNRDTSKKTLLPSRVCVRVHGRLMPEPSSLPANPSWDIRFPHRCSNHLFLPLSSTLPRNTHYTDPNLSLPAVASSFCCLVSWGLLARKEVYFWNGEKMLKNKAILLASVMNNAFHYVFYESLLETMKLSRNVFVLWGKG